MQIINDLNFSLANWYGQEEAGLGQWLNSILYPKDQSTVFYYVLLKIDCFAKGSICWRFYETIACE